jgi:hypothetical protein
MKSITDAVTMARLMNGKPAPHGEGHCQEFVRECYGVTAWATSAKLAWEKTPLKYRNTKTPPPAGAMVYYPSLSVYGHVTLSVGGGKVATNDYCQKAAICVAPWDLPNWHGASHYAGWSFWTPFGVAT